MRQLKKTLSIRLGPKAEQIARANAADYGVGFSEYIEQLLLEQGPTKVDYFAQQAAFQSFIAAAFSVAMARRNLAPAEFRAVHNNAYQAVSELFGNAPRRPSSLGEPSMDCDPRLIAFFEAFAGVTR